MQCSLNWRNGDVSFSLKGFFMRHAYMILAHTGLQELRSLIHALDYVENDIFIHIDAKAPYGYEQLDSIKAGMSAGLFFVTPQIDVTWGGSSQVLSHLALLKTAYANTGRGGGYRYYHMLSGLDFPVKSHSYIMNYFKEHDGENFMSFDFDDSAPSHTQLRCDQYHFLQDSLIGKKRNIWKYVDFASCYTQRTIGIRRFRGKRILKGSSWWSITDELAGFYVRHANRIASRYRWTYCADECYEFTEIEDTPYIKTISPLGNLRFIEWEQVTRRDRSPRALTMDDFETLQQKDILFARKFIYPQSKELEALIQSGFVAKRTRS